MNTKGTSRRSFAPRLAAVLGIAALATLPLLADNGPAPVIQKVQVTPTQLIVSGTSFGAIPPTVTVCGAPATVGTSTETTVTVSLPSAAQTPGTCLLTLVNNSTNGDEAMRTVTFSVTIPTSQKAIAGNIHPDGGIGSGSGFTSTYLGPGHYQIVFPAGTWNGTTFPVVLVGPVFGPAPNLGETSYFAGGDGSLTIQVYNNGVDINFFFIVMQS